VFTIKRALISVYDKKGIVPFAKKLRRFGVEIISTGGTLSVLKHNKIKVTPISDVTGFPEILDGRVKTLHPLIHSGLLFLRRNKRHKKDIKQYGIKPIDMVVVNLYPFTEVIRNKNVTLGKALDNIDIGGPSMLRAAAKNFSSVAVVSDVNDYDEVLGYMKKYNGKIPDNFLKKLAIKVFSLTSYYDSAIHNFLSEDSNELPERLHLAYQKAQSLRYGENPHQKGAFYKKISKNSTIKQLHGKQMSYNNIMDFYAALEIINEFKEPAAAVIKHTNPCGIGENPSLLTAIHGAIDSDPLSAFGGIVVVNRLIDKKAARFIFDQLAFFELMIAPRFTQDALKLLKQRKNLRVIEVANISKVLNEERYNLRFVNGGLLVQDHDYIIAGNLKNFKKHMKVVSRKKPSSHDISELIFAWMCAKVIKSNAIVITQNKSTVGIGAGQMSRIDSMHIACRKAGLRSQSAYCASDGFFPKPDNIGRAYIAGIKAIIQPGGSIRDNEVIDAVNKHNMIMVCTGRRHFRH